MDVRGFCPCLIRTIILVPPDGWLPQLRQFHDNVCDTFPFESATGATMEDLIAEHTPPGRDGVQQEQASLAGRLPDGSFA
jgi:hypothetical protein